jgi:ATP-dependent Clp protease ATP-binding subunit ClpB
MEAELSRDLPGELEVLRRVGRGIRKSAAGIKDPRRPLGSFLVVGPQSGAIKLARGVARFLYGDEGRMLSLALTDYSAEGCAAQLFRSSEDSSTAQVSSTTGESLSHEPQRVFVLEGIDTATWEVLGLVVAAMDEGKVTDGGRTVSLRNSVLLLTTLVGYVPNRLRPEWVKRDDGSLSLPNCPDDCRHALSVSLAPEVNRLIDDILLLR